MKFKLLYSSFLGLILLVSSLANAGLITENYTAEVSFSNSSTFQMNDIISWEIQYEDTSLIGHGFEPFTGDISYTIDATCPTGPECNYYSLAAIATGDHTTLFSSFLAGISDFQELDITNDINENLRLRTSSVSDFYYYRDNSISLIVSSLTSGEQYGNARFQYINSEGRRNSAFLEFRNVEKTTSANQISEPSTLTIFTLGVIGLASRRFNKQS